MGGGVTPADRWDELLITNCDGQCDSDDWLVLAVDALDQAGIDVQRVGLVSR
jgi:hypothetical protein